MDRACGSIFFLPDRSRVTKPTPIQVPLHFESLSNHGNHLIVSCRRNRRLSEETCSEMLRRYHDLDDWRLFGDTTGIAIFGNPDASSLHTIHPFHYLEGRFKAQSIHNPSVRLTIGNRESPVTFDCSIISVSKNCTDDFWKYFEQHWQELSPFGCR
jgi:hypothetical protein